MKNYKPLKFDPLSAEFEIGTLVIENLPGGAITQKKQRAGIIEAVRTHSSYCDGSPHILNNFRIRWFDSDETEYLLATEIRGFIRTKQFELHTTD